MRDVSFKVSTRRSATARAVLSMSPATMRMIREKRVPKGDPLEISKAAAVMAAKKTQEWIPYCHNIPIEYVTVSYELFEDRIQADVSVVAVAKTGVEVEAMTAAAAAALNLYDMLKMVDDDLEILGVRLLEKKGGKSDAAFAGTWTARVLVCSDRVSAGEYGDHSGEVLLQGLLSRGAAEAEKSVVPDEAEAIRKALQGWIEEGIDIVLVSGGTGIGPRDVTPEALEPLLERRLPGVEEALRNYSQDRIRTAMLSRSIAGVAGKTVVAALPGSVGAAEDALHALFPPILHALAMLGGGGHE